MLLPAVLGSILFIETSAMQKSIFTAESGIPVCLHCGRANRISNAEYGVSSPLPLKPDLKGNVFSLPSETIWTWLRLQELDYLCCIIRTRTCEEESRFLLVRCSTQQQQNTDTLQHTLLSLQTTQKTLRVVWSSLQENKISHQYVFVEQNSTFSLKMSTAGFTIL